MPIYIGLKCSRKRTLLYVIECFTVSLQRLSVNVNDGGTAYFSGYLIKYGKVAKLRILEAHAVMLDTLISRQSEVCAHSCIP